MPDCLIYNPIFIKIPGVKVMKEDIFVHAYPIYNPILIPHARCPSDESRTFCMPTNL
jgi:hypothetical protein